MAFARPRHAPAGVGAVPGASTGRTQVSLVEEIHERFLGADVPVARDVASAVEHAAPLLERDDAVGVVSEVLARLGGIGPLSQIWADDDVSEVMINGSGPVTVERRGRLEAVGQVSDAEVKRLVEYLLGPTGRRVDRRLPVVDVRLDDRTRCHIVIPPVAVDGPYITLRRFPPDVRPLESLADPPHAVRLRRLVAERANMIVFGPTSSGKTSLAASLLCEIAAHERLVVVEEAAELPRLGHNTVRLEGQPPNVEGVGAVPLSHLVVAALRMRPDRLVIGEVRGREAADLLQALTTGHRGAVSTMHADDPDHARWRLEQLARAGGASGDVAGHLRSTVDAWVHMARLPDGRRGVRSVVEDRALAAPTGRSVSEDRACAVSPGVVEDRALAARTGRSASEDRACAVPPSTADAADVADAAAAPAPLPTSPLAVRAIPGSRLPEAAG